MAMTSFNFFILLLATPSVWSAAVANFQSEFSSVPHCRIPLEDLRKIVTSISGEKIVQGLPGEDRRNFCKRVTVTLLEEIPNIRSNNSLVENLDNEEWEIPKNFHLQTRMIEYADKNMKVLENLLAEVEKAKETNEKLRKRLNEPLENGERKHQELLDNESMKTRLEQAEEKVKQSEIELKTAVEEKKELLSKLDQARNKTEDLKTQNDKLVLENKSMKLRQCFFRKP